MDQDNQLQWVQQALAGDKAALEKLVHSIQGLIYNLAVRFYWNPLDAQDATQEILIKIITNLAKFEGRSKFTTWSYRVATNYLLNAKRTEVEQLTFEEGAYHLQKGVEYPAYEGADHALLEEEVKISCTTSMLVCLSRPLRLAYLIGEILEFNSTEASFILEIEAATFRKRLSLARRHIRAFMSQQCGIFDPKNPCRCARQICYSLEVEWFKPNQLNFADKGIVQNTIANARQEIEYFLDEVAIFNSHPHYQTPEAVFDGIKNLINDGQYSFLN